MNRPWHVYAVEQNGEVLWSKHGRLELAQGAARRYRRRNTDTDYWVDHYGYLILGPGGYREEVL